MKEFDAMRMFVIMNCITLRTMEDILMIFCCIYFRHGVALLSISNNISNKNE